jgi:Fe2+ transport system protein FeoA
MMATQFTCPLCGHGFDPAAHLACRTCPLHTGCRLVCCPSCGHTTVDQGQSRLVRWITGFLDRTSAQQQDRSTVVQLTEQVCGSQCALTDLPLDRRARVVDVSALPAAQREQLQGYGILPGCVLRVTQRTPVTVVQIEHTELAIETEVARAVCVEAVA